ncbi:MAG: MBL fold metallo-hydrolase [Muribaculaceae bacterium]|nr:MBL fold metallo-hydrolase [Muribaculaceae bacterium]
MVTIRYVWHASFLVTLPDMAFLFDFWKNPEGTSRFPELPRGVATDIPLYVFVSHAHKDHFNPCVFDLAALNESVRLIISKDVARMSRHRLNPDSAYRGLKVPPQRVSVVKAGDNISFPGLDVRVYGSTDAGNSYMLETGGMRFFHAGDLNAWILQGMGEAEQREARCKFKTVVEEIVEGERRSLLMNGQESPIEAMFFPVDRRIGPAFSEGAEEMVARFAPRRFLPMHFYPLKEVNVDYQLEGAAIFAMRLPEDSQTEVAILSRPGDILSFPARKGM